MTNTVPNPDEKSEAMMPALKRFNLQTPADWDLFTALFRAYLAEVCGKEELLENLRDLRDEALNRQLIAQTLRKRNPYCVMQIVWDGQCAGLISFAYREETRTGFINNFYVRPEHRNAGIGSAAYRLVEARLASLGAGLIELVPVAGARPFYARLGFAPSRTSTEGEQVYGKRIP